MGLIGRITTDNQQKHIKLPPFGRAGVGLWLWLGWVSGGCLVGIYMSDAAYFVL